MTSRLMPASLGVHGPGEMTMWLGASAPMSSTAELVVAHDAHVLPQLAQVLGQVVGERVVVVDEQQHVYSCPARDRRASSTAASTARALLTDSSNSADGTLPATMPAPAWT